jgi:hypothetical protein
MHSWIADYVIGVFHFRFSIYCKKLMFVVR